MSVLIDDKEQNNNQSKFRRRSVLGIDQRLALRLLDKGSETAIIAKDGVEKEGLVVNT